MEHEDNIFDIINSNVKAGKRDAAVYTRDKRLFIIVYSPTMSHPLRYYDNDVPAHLRGAYHDATQEWIDSLDIVCITLNHRVSGWPTVAFGSIASIPTLRTQDIGLLKTHSQPISIVIARPPPLIKSRTRKPRDFLEDPRMHWYEKSEPYNPCKEPQIGSPGE